MDVSKIELNYDKAVADPGGFKVSTETVPLLKFIIML